MLDLVDRLEFFWLIQSFDYLKCGFPWKSKEISSGVPFADEGLICFRGNIFGELELFDEFRLLGKLEDVR
jgi:hypothetical protein